MPESSLSHRRLLACLVVCIALLQTSKTWGQTWREVESPHFRVVTDGSERDGRNVAKEFEQMRSVFTQHFNNVALESGAPLLIVAVHDPGLHALGPEFWKDRERVAGVFFRGWERQYAMVRLDTFGDLNQAVVFHEYTHSVLHANLHWLPTWLDEGLAEFYAYTRFQGDRTYVGAPSVRFNHLKHQPLIPISEMLTANNQSIGKDSERNDLFYGEAWAMVHFMNFGPEMGGGAQLDRFIALLESGKPQSEAFRQVFGDPKLFESKLFTYILRLTVTAAVLPPSTAIDARSFPSKTLTAAEADYELGSFDIGAHDRQAGEPRLKAAESAAPALAGPHEELGFLAWREGHDEQARTEWQQAVSADSSRYRSAFALLMSATSLKAQNPQQLQQTEHTLEAIRAQAPRFAPALVELALIQWRLGQLNLAYKTALAAERLEPWRAGYHVLIGYILLQGKQPQVAADYARTVASRWTGSDHDEAVDLWNLLPGSARGDGSALAFALPADATIVRGTIVSTACDKSGLSLTLQPDTPNAAALKLTVTGRFESGFSDTLWVGADHFTPCFHLGGLPALVAYKPDPGGTGTMMVMEIRDDLPGLDLPKRSPKIAEASPLPPSTP